MITQGEARSKTEQSQEKFLREAEAKLNELIVTACNMGNSAIKIKDPESKLVVLYKQICGTYGYFFSHDNINQNVITISW